MTLVLLVEDDTGLRQRYKEDIVRKGFAVVCVADGSEIEKIVTLHRVNILLSDTDMPKMNGDVACRKLLQEGKIRKEILVIGMSSKLDCLDYWKGVAHDVFSKKAYEYRFGDTNNIGDAVLSVYRKFISSPEFRNSRYKEFS